MTTRTKRAPLAEADVDRLYERSIVIDGSIAPHMDDAQIKRMRDARVTAVNWTVCMPWFGLSGALKEIAAGLEVIASHPDELLLVRNANDIRTAKAEGKVAIIFGPQNARPCEDGIFCYRVMHELGVRILQLTYNERNLYGDGVAEPADAGLSVIGRQAIEEMNRLGIVIDLSHCGDRTTLESIEASADPIVITHANARALHPSPRNKTDEQIKACAARGGLIGITTWSPMLGFDRWPTVDDFVRHMDHVANLVGIEHVSIGTDHNESANRDEWTWNSSKKGGRYPSVTAQMGDWYVYETRCAKGASSILDLPRVARAIATLGLTSSELDGVLGGNLMRIFERVWHD
jgi:membrane dipeptidase